MYLPERVDALVDRVNMLTRALDKHAHWHCIKCGAPVAPTSGSLDAAKLCPTCFMAGEPVKPLKKGKPRRAKNEDTGG